MRLLLSKAEKKRYFRRLRLKIYGFGGLGLLVSILGAYALLNWPLLRIQEIKTEGAVKIEDVRPLVFKSSLARFLGLDHFFSWPSKVGDWQIEKDYSAGTLRIIGADPEQFAIWCSRECFWVTAVGIAVKEAPDTEGTSISKITDERNFLPLPGKAVTDQDIFNRVALTINGMAQLPIRIKNYEFDEKSQELVAEGVRGERVIFSVRFDPSAKLFASLNQLINSGELRRSQYADLTVENRIYLKPF